MEHNNAALPDWVTGELGGYANDSFAVGLAKDGISSTPIAAHHRYDNRSHLAIFFLIAYINMVRWLRYQLYRCDK